MPPPRHPFTFNPRSAWPAIALAVVLLVANWPLVSGRECPPFDAYSQFGVYHHVVGAFARAGRWMTWNPWSNAGSPDYADPQFGAYSPLILVTAFLANGAEVGFRVYWLLEWYLGGLGMILLGRHLGIPRWGCFAVATGYAFSGWYTGHAEHTVATYAFSGLPWTIWRADVAMRHRRFRDAAQAGALLGLSALGGYPGVVVCNAGFTALWTFGRAVTGRRDLIPALARWMSVMSIITMFFGMVAAATYVPFFVDAGLLYYRQDLLEKHGKKPPRDWAELTAMAKEIMEAERPSNGKLQGFVWQGRAYEGLTCNSIEWVASFGGGSIVEPGGKISINNPQAAAAITLAKSWIGTISPEGVLNYAEEDARGVFQSGNAIYVGAFQGDRIVKIPAKK